MFKKIFNYFFPRGPKFWILDKRQDYNFILFDKNLNMVGAFSSLKSLYKFIGREDIEIGRINLENK